MNKSKYEVPEFQEKYGHLFERFDSILNVLHEGICFVSAQGVIVKMNPMYERLSGLPPEALLGKKVSVLNSKKGVFDEAEPYATQLGKSKGIFRGAVSSIIFKSKQPENSIQKTSGGRRNLLHGYPLLNKDGEVEMVVTFIRDISHLTLFKEQMAYHKDILGKFRFDIRAVESEQSNISQLVVESQEMKKVMAQIKKIAPTDATVLILGDTGVGKGEIARQIHAKSKRAGSVFFNADCTSIPESLVESELFGYAPGAFSGAKREGKPGYFELADNGTIFIDEIGELPLPMQTKLLRVLQDQEIMQVGSLTPKKVNTRIIAATNVNLEEAVANGRFRQDLYYRLHVSVLHIPSLKERVADILPLTEKFLQRYNNKYRKRLSFSEKSLEILLKYSWRGNVRELQNMIQGLVITSEKNIIEPIDLPRVIPKKVTGQGHADMDLPVNIHSGKSLKDIMANIEFDILQQAMIEQGSMTKVAKLFRLDRTTVSRKLRSGERKSSIE
jgi:transcriptional regulator with PAS, ATPase and Fis domain